MILFVVKFFLPSIRKHAVFRNDGIPYFSKKSIYYFFHRFHFISARKTNMVYLLHLTVRHARKTSLKGHSYEAVT